MHSDDPIKQAFHSLLAGVDSTFAALKKDYAEEVRCVPGCDDCCHAVFSVSFAEAYFIAQFLSQHLLAKNPVFFERLVLKSEEFSRERARLERELPIGDDTASSEKFGQWRIRCPMLEEEQRCAIYEMRPLTCRVYGLPLSIHGTGHVCGLSGFARGRDYPTVKMDNIHRYLLDISKELAEKKGFAQEMASKREYLADVVLRLAADL